MIQRVHFLIMAVLFNAAFLDAPSLASNNRGRVQFSINEFWRFWPGETEEAAVPDFDDSQWEIVDLPHTWNSDDAFDETVEYRRGVGWYRKNLRLDPAMKGKKIFLFFEGANQVADVYVHGRHAGRHIGGYTAFGFEVTPLITFEKSNVIAVRVDNSHDPDIPPLNADFTFYGGLYRDVWLIATEPVHVEVLNHASPGIFIDTPSVSDAAARVRIRGTIVNGNDDSKSVEVVNRIVNAEQREEAVLRSSLEIGTQSKMTFEQLSDSIQNPQLWTPPEPNLYTVRTEVYVGDKLMDRVSNPLGFRWFEFHPDSGFFLNGRSFKLTGTNRHQDDPEYGNALPNWAHRKDLELIKENGFNFLRLAHYPQDPVVLSEADRLGLAIWEEIPVVNKITMSKAFAQNCERMLTEMIRQHYNHPSILMWGYMNEAMLVKPEPLPDGYYEAVVELGKKLDKIAHEEDATRPTVTALSHGEIDNKTGFSEIPDILGMNLYFGWYYHELETFGEFLDDLHKRRPDRPLIVSEYGAGSDERVHTLNPRPFDFSTEYQQKFHEATFKQIKDRPYLLGSAVWNQFDFGSKGRHDTKPGINQKGLYFFDRQPKDIAFYYKAQLSAEPILHVAAREWQQRAGASEDERTQPIKVYSNLEEVELLQNGISLGKIHPENCVAKWQVLFNPGENLFQARGVMNGSIVEDQVTVHYLKQLSFSEKPRSTATEIAVNAGSHCQFNNAGSEVWQADRSYHEGGWGYKDGQAVATHRRISGTTDEPLYQTARDSVTSYRFHVPGGMYEVQLNFAEIEYREPDKRVFSVYVNDICVFKELDLAEEVGSHHALRRSVLIQIHKEKGILIRFEPRVGNSLINGIQVRKIRD